MTTKKDTVFCDIDGTILKYRPFGEYSLSNSQPTPGSVQKLQQWSEKGHIIILTTARPEAMRNFTVQELMANGILFDQLVMGVGRGKRYLVNDNSPKEPGVDRAIACSLVRDDGLIGVDI